VSDDPLLKLAAGAQFIGNEERPLYDEVLRDRAKSLGILERDKDGRYAIRQSLAKIMRVNWRTFGYLAPRGARNAADLACIPERREASE
jgi:hypothetical protein